MADLREHLSIDPTCVTQKRNVKVVANGQDPNCVRNEGGEELLSDKEGKKNVL